MKPRLHVAIAVLAGVTGGPASYGRRLVQALAAADHGLELSVLTDSPEQFAGLDRAGLDLRVVALPGARGLGRLHWQYIAVPRAVRRLRPQVYHDTKNALPFGLPCPAVVTVHDLAYHTVPQTFRTGSRWFLRLATADAVRRAKIMVVPSEATASDLRRIHPRSRGRIQVVPHGIDPAPPVAPATIAAVRTRLGLPADYVLHVGTLQARKHVELVIQGVRQLRQRGLPHRAVVVGRRGWLAEAALREIAADDTAVWLPHVAAADLPAVYAGAAAFVSPSAYEGFGLAVADALAAGIPVVIADRSSLPELCGDAALRLRDLSAAAVAEALSTLLQDRERARELGQRGIARAAQFRWSAAAAGHCEAYLAAHRQA